MEADLLLRAAPLTLRAWGETHRDAFAAMHADAEVMADLGGPIDRAAADAKFDRYLAGFWAHGVCRWQVEDAAGAFLGYAGVNFRPDADHPLGPHHEAGWRFVRAAWGLGYASKAAGAALAHAKGALGNAPIYAYTSPDNRRSQAVMARLGLRRAADRDFLLPDDRLGDWRGMVWVA
ncbi:MAG: GNAT family N-acetyltransferase [Proteobacteria bacterium]|nr:GNAT family N-acetyltransferase [Pseudomonadota bacterium]